jgi:hypothetical protein
MVFRESGRLIVLRKGHSKKRSMGKLVRRDGVSNVTESKLAHQEKTASPSVKTEEGTVTWDKTGQHEKA